MDRIDSPNPYQALLVVSFGGPEGPDEVMPFLRRVTSGRDIPDERLAAVAANYFERGGISPLNGLIRELLPELEARIELPLYWGNRNSAPLLDETVAQMTADGVTSALAFVTSAFASPSGCRQYLDDISRACTLAGHSAPRIDKLRLFHNHPGFLEPFADATTEALSRLTAAGARSQRLVFTAHSLPLGAARSAPYVAQLEAAAEFVAPRDVAWDLVYQSRSGSPRDPWLEPDIGDHLEALAGSGVDGVAVVPLGFVMDHMEVVHDLDTVAAGIADRLGMRFARAATPWLDSRFTDMIVALVDERIEGRQRLSVGRLGVWPDTCPSDCCRP